jgi:hypothetical protein
MSQWVSTLQNVSLGGSDYIFILAGESGQTVKLQRAINQSAKQFGSDAGIKARVVRAFEHKREVTFSELRAKAWPEPIKALMESEQEPFLVIIKVDFDEFNPAQDGWRIIWLGEGRSPKDNIPAMFNAFDMGLKSGSDIYAYLDNFLSSGSGPAPFGSISSPSHPVPKTAEKKGVGREGICDQEFGLWDTLDRLIAEQRIPTIMHGWKTQLVDLVLAETPLLAAKFKKESIRVAFAREGVFTRVEQRITEQESQ